MKKSQVPAGLKLTEHELMNWCISRLQLAQYYVLRYNAGKIPIKDNYGRIQRMIIVGQKGVSDIIGFDKNGKFCAFEIKVKPNKPSPAQIDFINEVKRVGGIGEFIYSQEDLEKFIKTYA